MSQMIIELESNRPRPDAIKKLRTEIGVAYDNALKVIKVVAKEREFPPLRRFKSQ